MTWRSDPISQTTGALPSIAFTSGTAKQIDTKHDRMVSLSVTLNPQVGAAATITVALSPDNATFSGLGSSPITAPATGLTGQIQYVTVLVPMGWWMKVTAVNATIGTGNLW